MNQVIVLVNNDGSTREMQLDQVKAILNAKLRKQPTSEGKLVAKCVNRNSFVDEESGEERIICNFGAIAPDQVQQLVAHVRENEWQEALNLGLSTSFRPNSRYIPEVGEMCTLSIGNVQNREDITVLRVVGVSPLPNAVVKTTSLDDLLGAAPANPPVSTEPDVSAGAINGMDAAQLQSLAEANGITLDGYLNSQGKLKQAKANLDAVRALLIDELV